MAAGFFIFTRHSERNFEEETLEFGYYQILKIATLLFRKIQNHSSRPISQFTSGSHGMYDLGL